jgi:hypothetical protein
VRVAAVDWSGRLIGARKHIWIADAGEGLPIALVPDLNRDEVGDYLVNLAHKDPAIAVGLDFAFSLPVWFLDKNCLENGMAVTDEQAEAWLGTCPPPFWGRPGRKRGSEDQFRRTEQKHAPSAKSVFQIGGAGAVGTGSLRGFSLLRRLQREGFAIWPFDEPRLPVVLEIYPRLLAIPPLVKSRLADRRAYVAKHGLPAAAVYSEDAFDAAISADAMARRSDELAALAIEMDPEFRREGRIWH